VPSRPISETLYQLVALDARLACGYCRAPQIALPYRLEIEHLLPTSRGGADERHNLWLSCHKCNKLRSNRVTALDPLTQAEARVFDPRRDEWNEHFAHHHDGRSIVGRTAIGRATVAALRLNDMYHVQARSVWIVAGVYPPPPG
jgi:5-methylcytosine-specific restriction endonuclease McrA